jgi:hypothetical protein
LDLNLASGKQAGNKLVLASGEVELATFKLDEAHPGDDLNA